MPQSNEIRDLIETNRQLILQFGNLIDLNREMFQSYTRLTSQYISNSQRNNNFSRNNTHARSYATARSYAPSRNYQYTTPYYYYMLPRTTVNDTSLNTPYNFFDPITIYPTATQIENAVRRVEYGSITSPINLSCPITLERFNNTNIVSVIRYCGHIFNSNALNTWFRTNCRCPVCRYDIRTPISNERHNNLTQAEVPEPEEEQEQEEEQEEEQPTREETPLNNFTNIVTNLLNETISIDEGFSEIMDQLNTMDSSSNLSIPITMFSVIYDRYRTI
jgi:hypothetical protein